MKNRIISNIKHGGNLFCLMFTFTTLASSVIQLAMHQEYDTNTHILSRAFVVSIGTLTIILFDKFFFYNKIVSWLITYAISMSIVFVFVWICGHFEELARHAYRDIFLNYTAIAIIVSVVTTLKNKIYHKKHISRDKLENKSI